MKEKPIERRFARHLGTLTIASAIALSAFAPTLANAQNAAVSCPSETQIETAKTRFASRNFLSAQGVFKRAADCGGVEGAALWAGRTLLEMGKPRDATPYLEDAVRTDGVASEASVWLAIAAFDTVKKVGLFRKSEFAKKGRNTLERVIRANPGSARARFTLATFYLSAPGIIGGGDDKAMATAAPLSDLDPALHHRFRARVAKDDERWDDATRQYNESLFYTANANTYWEAGQFQIERNDGGEAMSLTDAARTSLPNNRCFDLLLGQVALLTGTRLEEARDAARKFNDGSTKYCSRRDMSLEGYLVQGRLHERLGEKEEAKLTYSTVFILDPDNDQAKRAMRRLGG